MALVTGGSKGIGRGIAEALVAEGAKVAVASREQARADEAASAIGARGVRFDSDDLDAIERLLDAVTDDLGPIDVYIANTGGPPAGDPLEFTASRGPGAAHAAGLTHGDHSAAPPGMREQGFGRVVRSGRWRSATIDALQLFNAHRPGSSPRSRCWRASTPPTASRSTPSTRARRNRPDDRHRRLDRGGGEAGEGEHAAGRLGTVEELAAAAVFFASPPAATSREDAACRRRAHAKLLDCPARPHGVTVSTRDFHSS